MTGESDLSTLIQSMQPVLNAGEYVFISLDDASLISSEIPPETIVGMFTEQEGRTYILPKSIAEERGFRSEYTAAWITLTVHSSLAAVGLTAVFSTALAQAKISCNVVAGYYHDHVFVAYQDAERAIEVLEEVKNNKQDYLGETE